MIGFHYQRSPGAGAADDFLRQPARHRRRRAADEPGRSSA